MISYLQNDADRSQRGARPPILIGRSDYDRLHAIAILAMVRAPRAAGGLLDELARAEVREDSAVPHDAAGIGALVTFRDLANLEDRNVRLVGEETGEASDVPVLSPLGSALIGLTPGQSIHWPDRRGASRRLFVVAVHRPMV
jgi:regulator of nucleoside diphosphate kinase